MIYEIGELAAMKALKLFVSLLFLSFGFTGALRAQDAASIAIKGNDPNAPIVHVKALTVIPQTVALNGRIAIPLRASIENPLSVSSDNGPFNAWILDKIEYSADGYRWQAPPSLDSYSFGFVGTNTADTTFRLEFYKAGYWRVRVSSTPAYYEVSREGPIYLKGSLDIGPIKVGIANQEIKPRPQAGVKPYFAFPFSIGITMNGTEITNKTQTVIVGQQISLGTIFKGSQVAEPINPLGWTVPSTNNAGFNASNSSGHVVPLTNTGDFGVVFYWVDGSLTGTSKVVTESVVDGNGQIYSASTTFNVVRPSATITSTTSSSSVGTITNGNYSYLGLEYGPGSTPGINFQGSITYPTGYSGSLEWVQLTNSATTSRFIYNWLTNTATAGLDTVYPYAAGLSTQDSPAFGLSSATQAKANEQHTMYLMFQPSSGGEFVPLRKVTWTWIPTAVQQGDGSWMITDGGTTNPSDQDTIVHPDWSNLSTFGGYQ